MKAELNARKLDQTSKAVQDQLARAATATIREIGKQGKEAGQRVIAAAGFSGRWQRGMRSAVMPRSGYSLDASGRIFHSVGFFGIFQEGATISGSPLLWLPLPEVPFSGAGHKQLTPKQFVARVGPLVSINVPGKPPMLAGPGGGIIRASKTSVKFRRRALKAGNIRGPVIPLFIGVSSVSIAQKLDIVGAVKDVVDKAGEIFDAKFAEQI